VRSGGVLQAGPWHWDLQPVCVPEPSKRGHRPLQREGLNWTPALRDNSPALTTAASEAPAMESTDVKRLEPALTVAGLFAGIGGIEVGFHRAGHSTELLCEIDSGARAVLRAHFPDVPIAADVRELGALPSVDLVAAGFPCQDLSQAGRTRGISGAQSGLVGEVFRLLDGMKKAPKWLLLENVPFMLQLERGGAMRFLTETLSAMGYTWAYRVIDTRSFGLPQRRLRVILLASKTADPREILFGDDAGESIPDFDRELACGFYWTEGKGGLGWAVDAVPTIKGGSTVGIASPPAIWLPQSGEIALPDVRDGERLQGFDADWTLPALAESGFRRGTRWKLVGNAVSVPVSEWVGRCLRNPRTYDNSLDRPLRVKTSWPKAAWGRAGEEYEVAVTTWPLKVARFHLAEFLQFGLTPLSERATAGFLSRTRAGTLRFQPGFLEAVEAHLLRYRRVPASVA